MHAQTTRLQNRRTAKALANQMFALGEPWRGRFLNIAACLATGGAWDGEEPTQVDLEAWLRSSPRLRRDLELILLTWKLPG